MQFLHQQQKLEKSQGHQLLAIRYYLWISACVHMYGWKPLLIIWIQEMGMGGIIAITAKTLKCVIKTDSMSAAMMNSY